MKITELEVKRFQSHLWNPEKHERTPGLHLTDIISTLMEEQGETPDRPDISEADLDDFGAVGFLWERVLVRALTEMYCETANVLRLGEFKKDGVYFTPDGILINCDGSKPTLEEWKCVWRSCNRLVEDEKKWWYQIKAYLHALDLDTAILRVLYINGTWRPPIPRTRQFKAEFDKRELHENWLELMNYARSKGML